MNWDLEERAEDALVDWLKRGLSGNLTVYPGWGTDELEYPCAVVHIAASEPVSDTANWDNNRKMVGRIAVITEAAPQVGSDGIEIMSARTRNASARSEVVNRIIAAHTYGATAAAQLSSFNELAYTYGLTFSMVQLAGMERTADEARRKFVTELTVDLIAQPTI